ncbi:hypothetical protein G6F36_016039 [Rhizopus arrhizus]|nr:hypothetical protein G6F36_016039 [Rhizopus arrhizus]
MTTIIEVNDSNVYSSTRSDYRLYTKGAAETIIKACTHYIDIRGRVRPMERHVRVEQEKLVQSYAERSLRTLALAYRDVNKATFDGK